MRPSLSSFLSVTVAVATALLCAVASARTAPDDWLDRPAKQKRSLPHERVVVSLRQLERQAARRLSVDPKAASTLTLGQLTDVSGYSWREAEKDFVIEGEPGGGLEPPVTLELFAAALRAAEFPGFMLTLIPTQPGVTDSRHRVVALPPELAVILKAVALRADYTMKAQAHRHLQVHARQSLKHATSPQPSEITLSRLVFVPGVTETGYEEIADGWRVMIRRADVALVPEQDVLTQAGLVTIPLPEDHPLHDFAREFTAQFAELEQTYESFRRLHVMYRLYLLCRMMRREEVGYDFSFWLNFPLQSHGVPAELPGLKPVTITRRWWGLPWATTEYTCRTDVKLITGGVLVAYDFGGQGQNGSTDGVTPPQSVAPRLGASVQDRTRTMQSLLPGAAASLSPSLRLDAIGRSTQSEPADGGARGIGSGAAARANPWSTGSSGDFASAASALQALAKTYAVSVPSGFQLNGTSTSAFDAAGKTAAGLSQGGLPSGLGGLNLSLSGGSSLSQLPMFSVPTQVAPGLSSTYFRDTLQLRPPPQDSFRIPTPTFPGNWNWIPPVPPPPPPPPPPWR